MTDNPNAAWENCDFYFWPVWYSYAAWTFVASGFMFGAYSVFVAGL